MKKIDKIKPVFVEFMPKVLKPGILYISREYKVAKHLCACGCGGVTVTPINGHDTWTLTIKNDLVTIRPSIGNWSGESPYHAHYYVTDNEIKWL